MYEAVRGVARRASGVAFPIRLVTSAISISMDFLLPGIMHTGSTMSGIEAAGLAIGLVPIVIEILKSYRATRDRLKTFARYTQVVYDVQLRFRVAATNFSNDCQLLLKAVVEDARELSEMVEDPEHDGWQDASLEERFRKFLERDYELCEEVIVRIRDVLRKTQAKLSKLNVGFVAGNVSRH